MSALLELEAVRAGYRTPGGYAEAVAGVSFAVEAGETVGLVGESGCGKTTLARAIVGLVPASAGSIRLDGVELRGRSVADWAPLRRSVQYVFQDPLASLNPRLTAARLIREPLDVQRVSEPAEREARVEWLMERVGLRADWRDRFPHQFSGGQRQRIGIARALALNPKLILCDEPVSALDVSIQAQIVNLLADVQSELGVAYLFISHDLALVEYVAHRVVVMYLGHVVEIGGRGQLWSNPLHPYTQALIDAIPIADPAIARRPKDTLAGDVPRFGGERPTGCCFVARCPIAQAICSSEAPPLRTIVPGHQAACHFATQAADATLK